MKRDFNASIFTLNSGKIVIFLVKQLIKCSRRTKPFLEQIKDLITRT